jgi:uncharacterized protein
MMAIDVHTHINGVRYTESFYNPKVSVEHLNTNNVDSVVLMPLAGILSNCIDHSSENDYMYEFCSKSPEHFIPCMVVNPRFGQKSIGEIQRCKTKLGMNILKLHPWLQGFSVSSVEMDAVAEVCQELNVSILFHDGTPVYSTPLQIARLAREYPRLRVISGHAGLCDLYTDSIAAAKRYPNYYICLCSVNPTQMQTIIYSVPPEQICVGSDMIVDNSFQGVDVLWYRWQQWRHVRVSDSSRDIIENQTPRRLLNLG